MPKSKNQLETVENQSHMAEWDKFTNSHKRDHPVLMPIHVDIVDGEIRRSRMSAGEVKRLFKKCKDDFPFYMKREPKLFDSPREIFEDYLDHFGPIDGVEGPDVLTPLDVNINQPTWMLYNLPRKNWKFSKQKQYSVENDYDDLCRNFVKICTLDNNNVLIMENRNRSQPKGLKFNLHVAINQKADGQKMVTDIIIDPGSGTNPNPPYGNPP